MAEKSNAKTTKTYTKPVIKKTKAKEPKELDGFYRLGSVGVDAGMLWIGDPCYIINRGEREPYKALGKTWHEFCRIMEKVRFGKSFKYDVGHEGLGCCVQSFGGDGAYDVVVEIHNGEVHRIIVDLQAATPRNGDLRERDNKLPNAMKELKKQLESLRIEAKKLSVEIEVASR